MAHVGTITGSATLDPSGYITGLNQMAQQTARFQQTVTAGSFGVAGMGSAATRSAAQMTSLNRSVYASMTAFYMLSRQITGALSTFEEYDNIISRISNTANMSTSSILGLSEALRGLNREMAGSRTDMMKGMYRAVQSGFTTPDQFMPIAESAMRLRTASGREINTTKSADAISVIRNSLGVKSGREGFITDMLLRGRDVGRYELNEMTSALGIPLTIYGNQFSKRIGSEETLRQVVALLSSSTQAGLSPTRSATGLRRLVEKTMLLGNKKDGSGKNLDRAVRAQGYSSAFDALNEGPMAYLETLMRMTNGGNPDKLGALGYGSREMMVLASTLRGNMGQTRDIYGKLSGGEIAGTTDKYIDRQKETWWYQRDRLRSAYEDSQLSLMQAMLPTMQSFATSLEMINDLFQALGPSIKNLLGLLMIGAGGKLMKNFFFRPQDGFKGGAVGGVGGSVGSAGAASMSVATMFANARARQLKSAGVGNTPYGVVGSRRGTFATPGTSLPYGVSLRRNNSPIGNPAGGRPFVHVGEGGRFVSGKGYGSANAPLYPSVYGGNRDLRPGRTPYSTPTTPTPGFGSRMMGTLGSAGRFLGAGPEGRAQKIEQWYNNKINKNADAAAASAKFGQSTDKLTTSLERANNRALSSAKAMQKLSGAMSTAFSIGNMLALSAIFSLVSRFIKGAGHESGQSLSDGVRDLSKEGSRENNNPLGLKSIIGTTGHGIELLGAAIFNQDRSKSIKEIQNKAFREAGYVRRKGKYGVTRSNYRRATMDDMLSRTLMENFSGDSRTGFFERGYGMDFDEKSTQNFKEYMLSGKAGGKFKGMFEPGYLQGTTDGKSNESIIGGFIQQWITSILANTSALENNSLVIRQYSPWSKDGVGLDFMGVLRGNAMPNLAAVKDYWKTAKKNGADISDTGFQKMVDKSFINSGLMPDQYFTKGNPDAKHSRDYVARAGEMGMTPEEAYAKREHVRDFTKRETIPGKRKDETMVDFLARMKENDQLGLYKTVGGRMDSDPKKKGQYTYDQLQGAVAYVSSIRNLGSMSEADMTTLLDKMSGGRASNDDNFRNSMIHQLRLSDPSQVLELVKSGDQIAEPVQKYSEALAFGSNAGYNAMLPYWAEKGDDKFDIVIKSWDTVLTYLKTMMDAATSTEEHTRSTAIAQGATSGSTSE